MTIQKTKVLGIRTWQGEILALGGMMSSKKKSQIQLFEERKHLELNFNLFDLVEDLVCLLLPETPEKKEETK